MSLLTATRRAILPKQYQFTDVPQAEANALIAFYHATDGPNWTASTNWLTDPLVNNWVGVTAAGGHVTRVELAANGLDGEGLSALAPLTYLIALYLYSNADLSGDIADLSALILLGYLKIDSSSVSGNIDDLSALTLLNSLWLFSTDVSEGTIGTMTRMSTCRVQDCGWAQAAVDTFIDDLWTRRDDFTDATPELNIGGNNAAPSGVYQNTCAPTTPLEKIYNLTHAQCGGDTFQTWTAIVWNGGSAP